MIRTPVFSLRESGVPPVGAAAPLPQALVLTAIVIGFAFKDIGENFLAGVMMAFNRPFRIGDTIKSGDVEGKIVELSLRDTHIKTFDGKDVYVPNGQILKNPVYNYTIDGFLRHQFSIGIDYNSDIKKARDLIMNILVLFKFGIIDLHSTSFHGFGLFDL